MAKTTFNQKYFTNETIAEILLNHARFLVSQNENLFRIRAYRQAALTIMGLSKPLQEIEESERFAFLTTNTEIGSHIAKNICDFLTSRPSVIDSSISQTPILPIPKIKNKIKNDRSMNMERMEGLFTDQPTSI